LDSIKRYPGFGYIFCAGTPTWSEGGVPAEDARHWVPPEADGRRTNYLQWFGDAVAEKLNPASQQNMISQMHDEVRLARRSIASRFWVACGPLAIARAFQSQANLDELNRPVLKAALEVFRAWMDGWTSPSSKSSRPCMTCTPGVDPTKRRKMFEAFLADNSEFGLMRYLTPRTLRNGLRDARRRWENIVRKVAAANPEAVADEKLWEKCPDPDSVLVACLILACFPDQAGRIVQHGIHNWPETPAAQSARGHQLAEGQANSQSPVGQALRVLSGFSEAVRDIVDCDPEKRPMGLAGTTEQAKKNWELFRNSG
jgi:hypothetical protein